MSGIVVSSDLFFANSLCQRAAMGGKSLQMLSREAALASDAPRESTTLLIIDLSSLGAEVESSIRELKAAYPNARLVAYGPHVHEELLATAHRAGCDEVLTRGQMNQQAGRLIALL